MVKLGNGTECLPRETLTQQDSTVNWMVVARVPPLVVAYVAYAYLCCMMRCMICDEFIEIYRILSELTV